MLADSSGEIDVKRVAQNVRVKVDSSGAINVGEIGGDFTVDRDSSGGIVHKDVACRVSVPVKQ